MLTVTIDEKYADTIKPFSDLQTATNIALKRYVIELITTKISELSEKNKKYSAKYNLDYEDFNKKISTDENFVYQLEKEQKLNWENDLLDWEFNYNGIIDWKQKLQNIL